jgi:phage tail sheath protein FI
MCIPDLALASTAVQASVFSAAQRFCRARQAFLIVDPPPPAVVMKTAWLPGADAVPVDNVGTPSGMKRLRDWAGEFTSPVNDSAAAYYPWVGITDPWNPSRSLFVPPSGSVAGVYVTIDNSRGVWKAPAGVNASLAGVAGLADATVTDAINGTLSEQGINCLRTLRVYGNVVWGARTLAGNSLYSSRFKYVSVIRLADFIQQSLQQSLRWAVFEPNDVALWASLALETSEFLTDLYSEGAFAGSAAAEAFQVVCDATTTSVADRQAGIVHLDVGFLPVEPAEFIELDIKLTAAPQPNSVRQRS